METPAPAEEQESPYQDKADAAVELFRVSLDTTGQVDFKSLVASLVPDADEVREVSKAVPVLKKTPIASPASMTKAYDGIKALKSDQLFFHAF